VKVTIFHTNSAETFDFDCCASFTVKQFVNRFLPRINLNYYVPLDSETNLTLQLHEPVFRHKFSLAFRYVEAKHTEYKQTLCNKMNNMLENQLHETGIKTEIQLFLPWTNKVTTIKMAPKTCIAQLRHAVSNLIQRPCTVWVEHFHIEDNLNIVDVFQLYQLPFRVLSTGIVSAGKWEQSWEGWDDKNDAWNKWNKDKAGSSTGSNAASSSNAESSSTSNTKNPHKLLKDFLSTKVTEKFLSSHTGYLLKKIGKQNVLSSFEAEDHHKALSEHARRLSVDLFPARFCKEDVVEDQAMTFDISDFTVPPNIWKNNADNSYVPVLDLSQVKASNGQQQSTGIALATKDQAITFLSGKTISDAALALLLPVFQDQSIVTQLVVEQVAVALLHRKTGAQIVVSCYLVQLGTVPVYRDVDKQKLPTPIPSCSVVFIQYSENQKDWDERCKNTVKKLLEDHPIVKQALITVVNRQVAKDKSSIRATLLIRKSELLDIMKLSGLVYYIIPLDETNKPNNEYRPIWLGPITKEEALRRANLDPKCLGIVTMRAQLNGSKQTVFAVRAAIGDVPSLRPVVTLSKQDSSYIAAQFKYEISPVPIGFDADNVKAIFQHTTWKIRPLLTKPGHPDTWIVACDQRPPQLIFCFEQGDIVLTDVNKQRSKSLTPQTAKKVKFVDNSTHVDTTSKNVEAKLDSFIKQQEALNATSSSSVNNALEAKLEKFIKQQEIINNSVQTTLNKVQQTSTVLEQRTTKIEENLQDVSNLRSHIDSRFDSIVALFNSSRQTTVIDIGTPTKPVRSRSRGRSEQPR
jgi:hypothetical protein